MVFPRGAGVCLAVVLLLSGAGVRAQNVPSPPAGPLSAEQIVEQMRLHDETRTHAVKRYRSERHYQVEYHGFPENLTANMVVEASFDAATGKSFKVVSQSGSKFLVDKVLRRAIDSEKEASQTKGSTALTPANYRFRLAGNENLPTGRAYLLQVEPIVPSRFLYRGKIWVDAADFAVVKLDTQPAKNPSFWISKATIEASSTKAQGFWFSGKLRSESKIRIGGSAVLTIDYGSYQVELNPSPGASGR